MKKSEKNKNKKWLKFPHFSSIWGKIPWHFQSGKKSPTFPWLEIFSQFSGFPVLVGTKIPLTEAIEDTTYQLDFRDSKVLIIQTFQGIDVLINVGDRYNSRWHIE